MADKIIPSAFSNFRLLAHFQDMFKTLMHRASGPNLLRNGIDCIGIEDQYEHFLLTVALCIAITSAMPEP